MKQFIAVTFIVALFASAFFSCKKDSCKGVACLNGGTCSNGNCKCPTGYSGADCADLETAEIDYYNNTFTPVSILINGLTKVIPAGGYVAYTGAYGNWATGFANTSGTASSGEQVGLRLTWDLSDSFAATAKSVYINVSPGYFFLKITNNSAYTISQVYVNYALNTQTLDYLTIPNTGNTYNIGYYDAGANSNLYLLAGAKSWNINLNLPFTQNQSYTFVAGN